jgi:hypothetical protein
MALAATTLSAAVGLNDTTILVASLTSFAVGGLVKIEGEFMKVLEVPAAATTPVRVLRGQEGTAQAAHASGIRAVFGLGPSTAGSDWPQPIPGELVTNLVKKATQVKEYNAAGAITLPTPGSNMLAIINGTAALAMTVAAPSTAQDGDVLEIVGNGKAAHTVTFTGGLGLVGATADVATFKADQTMSLRAVAGGGAWTVSSVVAGAATIAGAGLA